LKRDTDLFNTKDLVIEMRLFADIKNPKWVVHNSLHKRLLRLWNKFGQTNFPCTDTPLLQLRGYFLTVDGTLTFIYMDRYVIHYNQNLIEVRRDENHEFENELLKSIPHDIYADICQY
jgi:hypothetical protein